MNEWIKHTTGSNPPVDRSEYVEVTNDIPTTSTQAFASEINWRAVKFYRELTAPTSVDTERKKIHESIQTPTKQFIVYSSNGFFDTNGYQAACQKAGELYKSGEEPKIIIQYSKQSSGTT